MTVEKLVKSLSRPSVPKEWPVVIQTAKGYEEVGHFYRREVTVGSGEDTKTFTALVLEQ